MKVKSKIWFELNDGILMSEGRAQLLSLIASTGSLNKAAKEMNMSYQKAWKFIDSSNQVAKQALVERQIGGKNGGGTVLTEYGKKVLEAYETINKKCWEYLDEEIAKLNI